MGTILLSVLLISFYLWANSLLAYIVAPAGALRNYIKPAAIATSIAAALLLVGAVMLCIAFFTVLGPTHDGHGLQPVLVMLGVISNVLAMWGIVLLIDVLAFKRFGFFFFLALRILRGRDAALSRIDTDRIDLSQISTNPNWRTAALVAAVTKILALTGGIVVILFAVYVAYS